MTYDWYKIINKTEFEASGLVSKSIDLVLESIGQKTILVTKGNYISIIYNEVMLSVNMADANPFEFDSHAVFLDENDDIWLGILHAT